MIISAAVALINIIKNELDLPDSYGTSGQGNVIPVIINRDQNILLGNTDELQITVGKQSTPHVIANRNTQGMVDAVYTEDQQVLCQENYQIDLQSRNNDARDRQWEVVAALKSIYSLQQQELYGFKIFSMPGSFVNTGAAEGGSSINRFSLVVVLHVWYNKTKAIDSYYEEFPVRVDDEVSAGELHGAIEFDAEDDPEA
jgi:hypothetical protein